jgi:hypothetical protein
MRVISIPRALGEAFCRRIGSRRLFASPAVLHDELGFALNPLKDEPAVVGFADTELSESYYTPYDFHGTFTGMNCAACHTGELHHRGQTLIIDGGSGRVNTERFIDRMGQSILGTARNYSRLMRFWNHTRTGSAVLYYALEAYGSNFRNIMPRPGIEEGPGRSDTVSKGASALAYYDESNRQTNDAPVSVPSLWGTQSFDRFHVSGAIRQGLARDISATTAGGAATDLRTGEKQFNSSIDVRELHRIQGLVARLQPPRWPEAVFGAIDRERAERAGKPIYQTQCASCHEGTRDANGGLQLRMVALAEIGTDPNAAAKMHDTVIDASDIGLGRLPAFAVFQKITSGIEEAQFDKLNLSQAQREQLTRGRENVWEAPLGYKANPLNGIWATPPYLHNGSVLTLAELLRRPRERTARFRMCADTEYDSTNVGYSGSDNRPECTEINTGQPGNFNTGHEYGTELNDQQKSDLLEYLKTF